MLRFARIALGLCIASSSSAQITYVDATAGGNTTLADGSPLSPALVESSIDDLWTQRTFANGGTVLTSNDRGGTGAQEDCPLLRTRIRGLLPLTDYLVYGYFWGSANAGQNWRGQALPATSPPTLPLQGFNTRHFVPSTSRPMTILATSAARGTAPQTLLRLSVDSLGFETTGHFRNSVRLVEVNRFLYEAPLGVRTASVQGILDVYVDDFRNAIGAHRTWYDGVGYKVAPSRGGTECGLPAPPAIGFSGEPTANHQLILELSGARPSTPAILIFGLSQRSWNGRPLPLDLAGFGFPGCALNVSFDATLPRTTDLRGGALARFGIPENTPTTTIYLQWAVLAPAGLAATRSLATPLSR